MSTYIRLLDELNPIGVLRRIQNPSQRTRSNTDTLPNRRRILPVTKRRWNSPVNTSNSKIRIRTIELLIILWEINSTTMDIHMTYQKLLKIQFDNLRCLDTKTLKKLSIILDITFRILKSHYSLERTETDAIFMAFDSISRGALFIGKVLEEKIYGIRKRSASVGRIPCASVGVMTGPVLMNSVSSVLASRI